MSGMMVLWRDLASLQAVQNYPDGIIQPVHTNDVILFTKIPNAVRFIDFGRHISITLLIQEQSCSI